MRNTLLIATTLFAFASAPAFAAMGFSGMPAAPVAGSSLTKIAGPCGPGQRPTGSTSGNKGGCEAMPVNEIAPKGTVDTSVCGDGKLPTGSTSGKNGGCDAPATAAGSQPVRTPVQTSPCGPNEVPASSTSGAKGGCVAKP